VVKRGDPLLARLAQLELEQAARQRNRPPTTAEAISRVRATLLPHQLAFCEDTEHRKLGLVCGFGAGKTYGLVAKAAYLAAQNVGHASALFEPVASMLRDILERSIDDQLTEWQIPFTYRATPLPEYVLQFAEGEHVIMLRTIETWNRIRGQNLCAVGFDEGDTSPHAVVEKATRMALARLRAGNIRQFYAATTPEGYGWAYQTFKANPTPDTRLIQARTEDNPYLPDDFIPSLMENYPANLIQSYLNGEFVNLTTGTVYDRFDRAKHVTTELPDLDGEPLRVGVDFNVGNMSAVVAIRTSNGLAVVDEVVDAHDTDALGQELRRRYPQHRIYGYPDASGGSRSTNASRTDIQILEGYGISNQSPQANPPVRDRVAAVQALLENGKGQVRLQVHERCKKVIESLELQCWTEKGEPDKRSGYDHMNDALGYMVWREFNPLHARAGKGTGVRLY
jgi:hypothetical protein